MNDKITEIVFILDRSGSMAGLESDTIGGYNSFLEKQRQMPGLAYVTTVLFDNRYEILHERIRLEDFKPITKREYFVRGTTALLDALGKTISFIDGVQNTVNLGAHKVIFVIMTDGLENASQEYTYETVRRFIKEHQEKDNWEFIFLGANIDAVKAASQIGIHENRAANYHADKVGTELNYAVVTDAVKEFRKEGKINDDWKMQIDADYVSRSEDRKKK